MNLNLSTLLFSIFAFPTLIFSENIKDLDINAELEEVIVIAYGTEKKSSLIGSSESIKSDKIGIRSISSVTSLFLGNIAGVQSTLSDGQPGTSPSLRIRGFGSVNASNEPLYIVDGMIYSGAISNINPFDIESVSILKDAASTALYGSSAGNGVVLITTKKGDATKENRVILNVSQGFSQKGIKQYDRINYMNYYPLQWEMLKNQYINGTGLDAGVAAQNASDNLYNMLGNFNIFKNVSNDEIVLNDGLLNPEASTLLYDDFDWEGLAYRNGYRANYNLSYSTSTDKSSSFASISFLDDRGSMIETEFKKFGARLSYNIFSVKWFESGLNLSANHIKGKTPMTNMTFTTAKGNMTSFIRKMAPIYPVYMHNEDGSFMLDDKGDKIYDYKSKRVSNSGRHTIAEAELNKRGYTNNNYNGSFYLGISPIKGLKIRTNANIESEVIRQQTYYNTIVADGAPAGRLQVTNTNLLAYSFNQIADYKFSFDDNYIELMTGHENYDYMYKYMYVYKQKQIMEGIYELENFSTLSKLTSYTNTYKKEGYFSRININHDNTYYLSGSFRRDGSSRFAKGSRWGNFWSIGGAWRINQEAFINDISWIDNLKLRTSYGETGNDALTVNGEQNYYPWQTLYETGINNSSEAGLYYNILGNEDLKWETQKTWDLALEFSFLNRIKGTLEYFNKSSDNLLFNVPTAPSNGIVSVWQNLGKVNNKGFEFSVAYDCIRNKDWIATVGINGTFLKNEVKKMPDGLSEIVSSTMKMEEGKSIYEFYLKDYYGVNPQNGDALYVLDESKESEINNIVLIGDKKLTNDPNKAMYHYCGSSIPKFYGGFYADIRYKNFGLSMNFAYGTGNKIYDAAYGELMANQLGYAMHSDMLKAWRKEGDVTNVPRLDSSKNSDFGAVSDRFLVNGSYLTLQNLNISYDIPAKLLSKADIENITLSFNGENLFQINHRTGINALANYTGYTYNLYFPSRVLTFNINLTF